MIMTDTPPEQNTDTTIKGELFYRLAQDIANGECGEFTYCLQDGRFYVYHDGFWKDIPEIQFLSTIQDKLIREVRIKSGEQYIIQKGRILTKYSPSRKKQIIEQFKLIKYNNLNNFNWTPLINLKNGMVNPYDGEKEEHNHIFYSTNRLPYIYDDNFKCNLWIKTLNEIFEVDKEHPENQKKIDLLQEFFGYCLTRDTKQHKALLLLGESRSGKSTIIQMLRNVIGNANCSSVPLKYISNAQYTAMLINKLVNIDTDVSAKADQYEAEFKTITSGEPVAVNQKYVAAFDFVPYCKIVMAANIFPRITDHSSAFYNRLILIPCDRVFTYEEQNRDLPAQLLKELPGALNWSIEGLKRLTARGKFEDLDFMKEAIEELEDRNNPCNIFFKEHIDVDFNSYIEKNFLFKKYQEWCTKNEQHNISHVVFSQNLLKKYSKETPKAGRLSGGNRPWVWKNLRFIEDRGKEPIKEEINWQD